MANKTALCSIVGQAGDFGSLDGYSTDDTYAGFGNDNYWIYALKFTTPKFSGKYEKIRFDLSIGKVSVSESDLRYALCTSDENWNNYRWTSKEVEDPTQLVSGILNLTGLTSSPQIYTLEIETAELQPETTYYLYLWDHETATGLVLMDYTEKHTVTVAYRLLGGARIRTSSAAGKLHLAVINTADGWKRYIPLVYTADGWKIKS